jgi:hypothetical protein
MLRSNECLRRMPSANASRMPLTNVARNERIDRVERTFNLG